MVSICGASWRGDEGRRVELTTSTVGEFCGLFFRGMAVTLMSLALRVLRSRFESHLRVFSGVPFGVWIQDGILNVRLPTTGS